MNLDEHIYYTVYISRGSKYEIAGLSWVRQSMLYRCSMNTVYYEDCVLVVL